MFVDLTQYLWILWLIFIFIFIIIELLTLEFTFLMIAVGSLAGLGANIVGYPWWLQFVVAAIVSVLLILLIRPLLLRMMHKGADTTPTNIPALIGMRARVVKPVTHTGGLVKLANGETWTARFADSAPTAPLEEGTVVTVTAIDGATAVITPQQEEPPA